MKSEEIIKAQILIRNIEHSSVSFKMLSRIINLPEFSNYSFWSRERFGYTVDSVMYRYYMNLEMVRTLTPREINWFDSL